MITEKETNPDLDPESHDILSNCFIIGFLVGALEKLASQNIEESIIENIIENCYERIDRKEFCLIRKRRMSYNELYSLN